MFDEEARRESSWAAPLRILVITLILSGGFLYYYFGPTVDQIQGNVPQASPNETPIHLTIGGHAFVVPENYTQFPRDRKGGEREKVDFYAKMPEMSAFTISNKDVFESITPASPIVYFSIRSYMLPFDEDQRFERIYLNNIDDREPRKGPDGLELYHFSDEAAAGYLNKDLLIGTDDDGKFVAFLCSREIKGIQAPDCRRMTRISSTLGLDYSFRRAHLDNWREIDRSIKNLVATFAEDEVG